MQITFYWNSFIKVQISGQTILCDPWVHEISRNCGWIPNKPFRIERVLDEIAESQFIYISHIHYDHFDSKLLIRALNGCKSVPTFLIPKLNNRHLYGSLSTILGETTNIVELDPWQTTTIKDNAIQLTIIPQLQEMSSGDAGIGYDMDSSLCIYDAKTQDVFFN